MADNNGTRSAGKSGFRNWLRRTFIQVPLLGWFLGAPVAAVLEHIIGTPDNFISKTAFTARAWIGKYLMYVHHRKSHIKPYSCFWV